MPRCAFMPIRHVLESPQCQHSNSDSHVLLASDSAKLEAAMKMLFTRKSLLTLKTNILTPRCSPGPIRHVLEFPQCQPSNTMLHILLVSVPAELQAATEMVFTSEFLLNLKTDISTPRHSLVPIRHVPESPQCQYSNAASMSSRHQSLEGYSLFRNSYSFVK
ncbi:hypothetical protein L873DRAFT_1795939 [Choiromyces venosus 120613-1]|uniref:Uncharacterized protein n=1 Tax=Choiromyces venosus 120613-1 TaxID=1336337 RepID=A0A3N4IZS3_9PEZI|nr:hypothetical protein L873DRAFT_1795939 [Choiromyces venosus 120613-1]